MSAELLLSAGECAFAAFSRRVFYWSKSAFASARTAAVTAG